MNIDQSYSDVRLVGVEHGLDIGMQLHAAGLTRVEHMTARVLLDGDAGWIAHDRHLIHGQD